MKKLILFWTLIFSAQAFAGLLFNYSELALKDLDQMNALVMSKVKESKKFRDGKIVPLKEALQAVYSRPNEDGMIEKVIGPLRTELDEADLWEKAINDLTTEAINALKNPKAFKPVVQVSYQIFLENLLADMKPFLTKSGFERSLTEKVRDAKLSMTKEATAERKLRMMKNAISPSELAGQLLSEKSGDKGTDDKSDTKDLD